MGFLWEGSTGARAVQLFREMPHGTMLDTTTLAEMLGVKGGALHQLVARAVDLRLVKKIRGKGPRSLWALGAGNDSATIERHRVPPAPPTPDQLERRRLAAERRRQRAAMEPAKPVYCFAPTWPPGFVSATPEGLERALLCDAAALGVETDPNAAVQLPTWLRGLSQAAGRSEALLSRPIAPRPIQYLARWHVRYVDAQGQINGVLQVQCVRPDLRGVDAWCEARGGISMFDLDGFTRIADAESGKPVDLAAWLKAAAKKRPPQKKRANGPNGPRKKRHALRSRPAAQPVSTEPGLCACA